MQFKESARAKRVRVGFQGTRYLKTRTNYLQIKVGKMGLTRMINAPDITKFLSNYMEWSQNGSK